MLLPALDITIWKISGKVFNVVFSKNYIVNIMEFLEHREAGGVTEVRIFPKSRYIGQKYVGNVVSGYYNDYERLARDIESFDGKANIYVTVKSVTFI